MEHFYWHSTVLKRSLLFRSPRSEDCRRKERNKHCEGQMETHWMWLVVRGTGWPGKNLGCHRCITCAVFLRLPLWSWRQGIFVCICVLGDCVILPDLLSRPGGFCCCATCSSVDSSQAVILGKDSRARKDLHLVTVTAKFTYTHKITRNLNDNNLSALMVYGGFFHVTWHHCTGTKLYVAFLELVYLVMEKNECILCELN